jgi:uncharacterized protein involved in outer membrane biogenesis
MAILRVVKWIVTTVAIVVVAAVLYLSFADLNWLKPRIESAMADATGRELKLGGTFDIDILPAPAIELEDVSLSNAEWGSEPTLAKLGHLSARLGLWSLILPPVRVKELRLRDVDLLLETNEQGEANWAMGGPSEPEPTEQPDTEAEGSGGVPVIVELAELRNIRLRHNAPEAEPFVVALASLDISTDEAQDTVLGGKGEVDGLPLRLAGKLGPVQALASGTDIGIDLKTGLGNVDLDVDGTIGDLAKPAGINLKAVASSEEVAQILEHFAVDLPLTGALHVETVVTSVEPGTQVAVDAKAGEIAAAVTARQHDGTISFEAAVPALDKVGEALEIQGLPARDLAVDGRVVMTAQGTQLQGITARLDDAELKLDGRLGKETEAAEFSVKANGPSLATLSTDLPEIPFKAAFTANLAPAHLVLDPIETTFGESDLAGSLEVAMADKTAITGTFKSQRLDLTPFAAGGGEEAEKEEKKADKTAPEAKKAKSESKYVFVEDPLPFEELKKTDIDLGADIGRFTLNKIVLLDVSTAVDLKDGNLQLENRFRGPEGGKSVSDIALATAGESAKLDVNVNMRDLRLNLISGDIKDKSLIPPIGVTLDFESKGATPRALASSTKGRVLLTAGAGQIENNLLATVSGDVFAKLFSALNPFSKKESFTTTDCTILALDIHNGLANIAGLYAQGDKVKVVGDGDIDLNTEALNIEFNTKPRKGVGVSADMFVTPFVKLKGTLASPTVGLDKKGALLAAGTGGLSVLAQAAVDRVAGAKDNCAKVLEEVGDHPPIKW